MGINWIMIWMDYNIESFPDGSFAVRGDWPGEVMGFQKDGTPKEHALYRPGDIFRVNEYGILQKITDTERFTVYKEEVNK
jgi:hypothetical protein